VTTNTTPPTLIGGRSLGELAASLLFNLPQLYPSDQSIWTDIYGEYRKIQVKRNFPHPIIMHHGGVGYEAVEYASNDAAIAAWRSVLKNFTPSLLWQPMAPRSMPDIKHVYSVNGANFDTWDEANAYRLRYRKGELQ
jgi:hypothetical protein